MHNQLFPLFLSQVKNEGEDRLRILKIENGGEVYLPCLFRSEFCGRLGGP